MSTGQAAHGGLGGVGVGAVQALRSQLRGERDRAMGVQGGRSGPPPRTDEGAVGGGRDPGRDGPQGASGRRGGRDVGQTLK